MTIEEINLRATGSCVSGALGLAQAVVEILPNLRVLSVHIVGTDGFSDPLVSHFFSVFCIEELPTRLTSFNFECEMPLMAPEKPLRSVKAFMERLERNKQLDTLTLCLNVAQASQLKAFAPLFESYFQAQ